ncbi:Oxysterol-binding protein-related protein 9 [Eumeta japonica]|uniref:Oxysterol-binding protein-related protein 9 n=1 Tax=Eumeta variegata TaxID=151549 RepID=A0A4C1XFW2_EUMVA|nr:Oxysterol-binding protein-related protein 9 [Eumeta japonica]
MTRGVRRGCVRLRAAVIGIDDEDDSTFTITVDHKTFHFQARDGGERERWVRALEDTIARHGRRERWCRAVPAPAHRHGDLERRVAEADAYLQIMIDLVVKLTNRISELSDPQEKAKAQTILDHSNANHRVQRNNILKDKPKDAESTYKDAKINAKEYVKRRKNEIKERYDRRFFLGVSAFEDTLADDNVTATEYMIDDGNKCEITMNEIMNGLKRIKVGKAAGYDRVSSEILKDGTAIVASLLYQPFNKCWKSHRVPNDWCKSVIVLLYQGKGSTGWMSCLLLYADNQVILAPLACELQECVCPHVYAVRVVHSLTSTSSVFSAHRRGSAGRRGPDSSSNVELGAECREMTTPHPALESLESIDTGRQAMTLLVPDTSYSSSEGEDDFYDADDEPFETTTGPGPRHLWTITAMILVTPKEVTDALPTSRKGIGYLTETDIGSIGREKGKWATLTLVYWTKRNSESCYFMSIFCESVVFYQYTPPRKSLQWLTDGATNARWIRGGARACIITKRVEEELCNANVIRDDFTSNYTSLRPKKGIQRHHRSASPLSDNGESQSNSRHRSTSLALEHKSISPFSAIRSHRVFGERTAGNDHV